MTAVLLGETITGDDWSAPAAEPGRPPEWEPRLFPQGWWQTRQDREALTRRLLDTFTDPAAGRTRDKTRRRGLAKLLDWLQRQPGGTWQEKWLASGADAAGSGWADLPLNRRVPARRHHRDELTSGLVLLVAGQVIRPGYRWLLRQRQAVMLAEARAAIDPGGFARIEQLAEDAIGWARSDALSKLTWLVISKGGLVSDITVGDCIELTAALQEHHFRGSAGRPLFYALLKQAGVLPASAPARLRALRVEGRRSVEQIVDRYGIECRPVRDLLVEYFTERVPRPRPHLAAAHRRHHLPAVLAGPGAPPPRHRLAAAGARGRAGVEGTPGPHPRCRRASGPAPGELPQRAGIRPGVL